MHEPAPPFNGSDPAERAAARLSAIAQALPYPPTPDIAAVLRPALAAAPALARPRRRRLSPRLAWGAALAVLLLAVVLAAPGVRAGLLEFLQFGRVRIEFAATATAPPAATPLPQTATLRPPAVTPAVLPSIFDLAGLTTLEEAQARASVPIRLPAYPPDLGQPDAVFLQDAATVVLVWRQAADPGQARLSLHILGELGIYESHIKNVEAPIVLTRVNGAEAIWTTGPYVLRSQSGAFEAMRLVDGHVLIWQAGEVTYRLETDASMEEAILIAESIGH